MEKSALKKISQKTKLPFAKALCAYMAEELILMLSQSEFVAYMWLRDEEIFDLEYYRNAQQPAIDFAYIPDQTVSEHISAGQPLSLKMGYLILGSILKQKQDDNIRWKAGAAYQDGILVLSFEGEYEEMVSQVRMNVCEIDGVGLIPERSMKAAYYDEDLEIPYFRDPKEEVLAHYLTSIIKDMELIPQMEPYRKVYQILRDNAVGGMHVAELLSNYTKKLGIAQQQERAEEIAGYVSYPYMKKRWEKYCRAAKYESCDWNKVCGTINAFLMPIWGSVCKKEVFFGDWMPDIGRFLE